MVRTKPRRTRETGHRAARRRMQHRPDEPYKRAFGQPASTARARASMGCRHQFGVLGPRASVPAHRTAGMSQSHRLCPGQRWPPMRIERRASASRPFRTAPNTRHSTAPIATVGADPVQHRKAARTTGSRSRSRCRDWPATATRPCVRAPDRPGVLTLEEQAIVGADGDHQQQAEQVEDRQHAVADQQQRRGADHRRGQRQARSPRSAGRPQADRQQHDDDEAADQRQRQRLVQISRRAAGRIPSSGRGTAARVRRTPAIAAASASGLRDPAAAAAAPSIRAAPAAAASSRRSARLVPSRSERCSNGCRDAAATSARNGANTVRPERRARDCLRQIGRQCRGIRQCRLPRLLRRLARQPPARIVEAGDRAGRDQRSAAERRPPRWRPRPVR